jgi:hypothetical protein
VEKKQQCREETRFSHPENLLLNMQNNVKIQSLFFLLKSGFFIAEMPENKFAFLYRIPLKPQCFQWFQAYQG